MKTAPTDDDTRPAADNGLLLLVDYQVGPLWEVDAAPLRRHVARLAETARRLGVPTILTTMACDDWGPAIPELSNAARQALIVERSVINAWDAPPLRQAVESTKRKHLLVAGVAFEVSVAPLALAAARAGYRVHALIDASGHFNRVAASRALVQVLRGDVRITNSATAFFDLVRNDPDPSAFEALSLALQHLLPLAPAPPSDVLVMDSRLTRVQGERLCRDRANVVVSDVVAS